MTSKKPTVPVIRDAAYFDRWYAAMVASPARDAIIARNLGLPSDLQDAGTLTWQGVAEVTDELRLPQDGLLLDIACGRGGYGIEVAQRAGTRLVGVDFSAVALEQAGSGPCSRPACPRASRTG
jgi:SAM-dependent methyltransferase